jgi:hypothetical protein
MSVAVFSGLTISVPCITNLPEQTESSIAIYPNPVSNKLTIEFADDNFANEEYCIFNVYGQLVLKGEMRSRKNDLDLSTLDDGVYIIDIKGVQSSLRKRIIKQ